MLLFISHPRTAGKPYIIAVHPSEGWVTGGTKVCIVGMNFYEGVEVVFGTLPASAEVREVELGGPYEYHYAYVILQQEVEGGKWVQYFVA